MNGKAYASIVLQVLGSAIAATLWILCRNQPDMGGQLIYGYIGLPLTAAVLLLSTILAVLSARSDKGLRTLRNVLISINLLITMTAIYGVGQL